MATTSLSAALLLKNRLTNMSDSPNNSETELSLTQSVVKNATGLAIFAFITAGVIALTQQTTSSKIADNIAEAEAKALYQITPENTLDNDLLNDTLKLDTLTIKQLTNIELLGPLDNSSKVYFAKKQQKIHTLIFPTVAPDGYTTAIKLLIGVKRDGSLSGVRIVDHKETPGLGDKIDVKKSDWVFSFEGKSLTSPSVDNWKVKKDGGEFDQFTGATITPRAVVNAVKNILLFYRDNSETLFQLKRDADLAASQNETLESK
jgi:electron transport complex protein RnfG